MARLPHQFKEHGMPKGSRKGNAQRKAGLNALQDMRNSGGLGHNEFGSVVLSIPELDFYVLSRRYPDLVAPDAETNKKAWDRFLASPESAPYRTRTTDRKGVIRQSSIIVP